MIKKIPLILVIILFSSNLANSFYEEPKYYGTIKCGIYKEVKKTKQYARVSTLKENIFYEEKGDLFKLGILFKKGIDRIIFESKDVIIFLVKNKDGSFNLYENKNILVENISSFNFHSVNYFKLENRLNFSYHKEGKEYIYDNGKIILISNYKFKERFFSKNKMFFIDKFIDINNKVTLEKKGKNIFETNHYLVDLKVSNKINNYSFLLYNGKLNSNEFYINGKLTNFKNVINYEYSDNGNDLYLVLKDGGNYLFYKNSLEIGKFKGKVKNDIKFNITKNGFYTILTDRDNYAFIKNGETLLGYNSKKQIKTYLNKNFKKILLVKDNILNKDILYINGEKKLIADDIDERYLNGSGYFSLFNNKSTGNNYYTFIKDKGEHYLYINDVVIPGYYDYLNLKEGFNNFTFLSNNSKKIECRDIGYIYPGFKKDIGKFKIILKKLKNNDIKISNSLTNKLNNLRINNKYKGEIIKMILDNLD